METWEDSKSKLVCHDGADATALKQSQVSNNSRLFIMSVSLAMLTTVITPHHTPVAYGAALRCTGFNPLRAWY
jgi:hypothetical protein